ncbi:MAG: 50S ribosomal protein L18e [Candidatus Saliniplasma sp.]
MTMEKKTNPILVRLIKDLKEMAREQNAPIWRDVAERLEKPSSNWAEVNLSKIQRHADEDEMIIVPGKVLGSGYLTKKVMVGSFKASESAKEGITKAGGEHMSIRDMAEQNPEGSGIRLMG